MLAASLEDGSLGLYDTVHTADVRPRRTRMTRYRALLHTPPPEAAAPAAVDGGAGPASLPWGLAAGPPVAALPLLPRAWVLLLRLLLQRGLPEACFRELGALAACVSRAGGTTGAPGLAGSTAVDTEMALERLEDEASPGFLPTRLLWHPAGPRFRVVAPAAPQIPWHPACHTAGLPCDTQSTAVLPAHACAVLSRPGASPWPWDSAFTACVRA